MGRERRRGGEGGEEVHVIHEGSALNDQRAVMADSTAQHRWRQCINHLQIHARVPGYQLCIQ